MSWRYCWRRSSLLRGSDVRNLVHASALKKSNLRRTRIPEGRLCFHVRWVSADHPQHPHTISVHGLEHLQAIPPAKEYVRVFTPRQLVHPHRRW